jgi:TPR repeat protein
LDGVLQQMKILDVTGWFIKISILVLTIQVLTFATVSAKETLLSTAQKFYYGVGAPKNYHKAFKLYLKAAQAGNVDAMFIAGGMYMQGQGTTVNRAEAFKWLYKAAINDRSSKESERIIGQSFITGENVPQNYEEARYWYERAAEGGDAAAQSELGVLYFSGKMLDKDYEKARHWFDIAARNNYPLAQYNMGILWYTGNGVNTIDMVKAYAWFNLASSNGHNNGKVAKQFLETILSADELKSAQQLSIKLYKEIKQIKK